MEKYNFLPVILCGGQGTRLWPLSRKSYPKQFLKLNSKADISLLQQTQTRLKAIKNILDPILICNESHRFIVAEQMREIEVKPNSIILEPIGKNTAPAIALAAIKALKDGNNPILIVLASDHLIKDNKSFLKSLNSAINLAYSDKISTFGIIPTSAETGYGYIESTDNLDLETLAGSKIERFIEKPDKRIAERFVKDKRYSWNSGMFVFKASVIIKELEIYAPEIVKHCKNALNNFVKDLDFIRLNESEFSKCPTISIDVAVMEKTQIGSVVPLDAKWSDIGSLKSLWEYEEKNDQGNLIQGNVLLKKVKDSFFRSEKRLLVGLGVKDLIAIETDDVTLIANKESSQEIKDLVKEMVTNGIDEAINHKKGYRPWGNYLSLARNEYWQVKIIEVKPGASLSLQKHKYRSEHWVVVKGTALVTIEDKEFILKENQSVFIPLGSKHKLANPRKENLSIIEVQCGTYLGEDDIIRYEDRYGRK